MQLACNEFAMANIYCKTTLSLIIVKLPNIHPTPSRGNKTIAPLSAVLQLI